ncbi:MAG: amidohydrolase family protein [Pseudomonadota bacterium]
MSKAIWDTLIHGALVFDGHGGKPQHIDVAVKDGSVVAKGSVLPRELAEEVVDGGGLWLMPGLLDIHTHLDLEVDLEPGLPEAVRHGTTTVLVGNCSLGTCFGTQRVGGQDPIVDCFTRVENIPKQVLRKCVDAVEWSTTGEYMDHFANIPLGPNVAAFVPHSMLRIEVMGLEASVSRAPTEAELQQMCDLLEQALDEGYIGLSTDGLPFHYLSNDPNTDKRIPTQFASYTEMKRLLQVVRERNKVWQTTPIIENRLLAFKYFALTSGRLHGKPLKTSALAALDFAMLSGKNNPFLAFAKLMNTRLFKGNIHFQALGTNFRIWSDGVVSPLFEEMPSTCKLIAKEYDDRDGRLALLNDPAWVEEFRQDWYHGRQGFNWPTIKARLGVPDSLVIRELDMMHFDGAPVADWDGDTLQQVFDRLARYQNGDTGQARSDAEAAAFDGFPRPVGDDADFFLHLLREYDRDFRFWVDQGNVANERTLDLLLDENALPGFNDSGAHITNMAFFDGNLGSLKRAQEKDLETVSLMIKRITSEPAAFFGLDVGTLDIGAQADMILIDPQALADYECDPNRSLVHRDLFDHAQMVNRSDGVVPRVMIKGRTVWAGVEFTEHLGQETLGRALRAA